VVVIVMGVTGAGKTTIGKLLAHKLGWGFADADDFHPAANVQKMSRGIPLDDADRVPWLQAMHDAIVRWNASGRNVVLSCSALKNSYRDRLRDRSVQFVYLKGDRDLILSRLNSRRGHFATSSILDGQFRDLEEPGDAISVGIDSTPEAMVADIIRQLESRGSSAIAASPSSLNPLQ
jgi:gluconokinase